MTDKAKFIAAFLYAVATAVIAARTGDMRIDPAEWVTVAIAAATAAGVYLIPLVPSATWTKTAVAVLLAGLNVTATLILDNVIDASEWMLIVTAVLGALGVLVTPGRSPGTGAAVGWGSDAPVHGR